MSNHEPGTVAVATVRGVPNVRVVLGKDGVWMSAAPIRLSRLHYRFQVADIRPLVVLDFADAPRPDREHILRVLRGTVSETVHWIADQIEAQTQPPRPAEPLGLGAVVSDDGYIYHRVAGEVWRDRLNRVYLWRELIHPVVKSEGWTK